jgi:hypothetical protein
LGIGETPPAQIEGQFTLCGFVASCEQNISREGREGAKVVFLYGVRAGGFGFGVGGLSH